MPKIHLLLKFVFVVKYFLRISRECMHVCMYAYSSYAPEKFFLTNDCEKNRKSSSLKSDESIK